MASSEQDELPPLPQFAPSTSPKRLRQPLTASPAIVTQRIVRTPGPDELIANLIDSLTAISSQSAPAEDDRPVEHRLDAFHEEDDIDDRPQSAGSFYVGGAYAPSIVHPPGADSESDDDACPPAVIPFSRQPQRKRRMERLSGLSNNQTSNTLRPERSLSVRGSVQSLRSLQNGKDTGLGGLEKRNGSATSLTASLLSLRNRSPRKLSPAGTPKEHSPTRSRAIPERAYSDSILRPHRSSSLRDSNGDASVISTDDSQTSSTLSPLNREKLEEHLIPSRQSSMRTARRGHHRHSTGSRDLKDLQIDEELISSDDSTVRRIKELQEAKERRHSEWRKESSPSEPTPKRHSAPSPKALRRSSTYQSSKLSVTEVLIESEHEDPHLTAQISAADLALMPAIVANEGNSPLTPVGGHSTADTPAPPSNHQPASVPTLSAPVPPRDRTAIQHKRLSSMSNRESRVDEVRSISDEVETFLSASRLTQKLRHPRTGRTIAFSEVGDPNGFVVFCCVGMGLTRFIMTFYDELARSLRLRLLTPDRPGVGESEAVPERLNNPLTWVDDVSAICEALEITRFSLLAHSAGTIYAMATALKLPQFVRGRIHLLAPWIPPSQMPKSGTTGPDAQPVAMLPMSHRVLSVLPTSMLKIANSRFLSTTSASVDTKPTAAKRSKQVDILEREISQTYAELNTSSFDLPREIDKSQVFRNVNKDGRSNTPSPELNRPTAVNGSSRPASPRLTSEARAVLYNRQLTHRIWTLATHNANPALDLMTCLERKKTIGFRYADITRAIVMRHGAKDNRVPLDNVKFLDSILKRSELRILEDEGHSLMRMPAL
ncbi:uncharacterized protein AB675_3085 [Cyphellophora attinorum]|uniref:AB hydrolase-1 domain-containing protein n=1 Tax=Cyphellophora attinorum TaxID=1664694 RepID=A0A0N1NZ97_9EURO|nr:uncharacterized protein AB675_3085 [Phialophora attinorum]KPI38015.1 hypothetical protein AB675_3085 [Phialophora attinorum]